MKEVGVSESVRSASEDKDSDQIQVLQQVFTSG